MTGFHEVQFPPDISYGASGGPAYPCHCGFLTEKHRVPHLLHAHALRRKVIEEPYAGEWPLKVKLAFRFRGHAV